MMLLMAGAGHGQTAQLRGRVTDPSGAVVPGAAVSLKGPDGRTLAARSADDGGYSFTGLNSGSYTVQASAPNLALAAPAAVTIRSGVQTLNLQLQLTGTAQQVSVQENAGPAVATDPNRPGVIGTPYGLLDPNPAPGERLAPRNFGRGPGSILLNLRLQRVFTFGPLRPNAEGKGDPRYNLSFSASLRNVLNHNNPGPIIGDMSSPLFGQANQPAGADTLGGTGFSESANNRRLELQTRFTF